MIILNGLYDTVDGEINTFHQGRMTTIIRTQKCNCKCTYCDTQESQPSSIATSASWGWRDLVREVAKRPWQGVTITGGEPLLQHDVKELVPALIKQCGKKVVVETNGTIEVPTFGLVGSRFEDRLCVVADIKLPSSGHYHPNNIENIKYAHVIKFVVKNESDLAVAKVEMERIEEMYEGEWFNEYLFAFSPIQHSFAKTVYRFMKENRIDGILNIQMHKVVNLK